MHKTPPPLTTRILAVGVLNATHDLDGIARAERWSRARAWLLCMGLGVALWWGLAHAALRLAQWLAS